MQLFNLIALTNTSEVDRIIFEADSTNLDICRMLENNLMALRAHAKALSEAK